MREDLSTRPVVLEAAINGQTTQQINPHAPRSSEEIAADARVCLEAGAAIVHTHNDEILAPPERAAELYLESWRPVLEERPDAILYPTIGSGATMTERLAHIEILARSGLRVGLVDPGSVNISGVDEQGVPIPVDFAYVNTPADIRAAVDQCRNLGLGPSLAIFEPGFLRTALAYERAGLMPRGAMLKLYLGGEYGYLGPGRPGLGFGLPPTPGSVDVYLGMLEGSGLPWSVAVLGGDVMENGVARHALERGGHLHVGIEDYRGERAPRNEELVREAAALAAEVGRPLASCTETSKLLDLPER